MLLLQRSVPQSVLDTAGPDAMRIELLWWILFGVASAVFVAVVVVLVLGLRRARRRAREVARVEQPESPLVLPGEREHHMTRVIAGATIATAVIVLAFVGASLATGNETATRTGGPDVLRVTISGYQWWWDVEYDDPMPSRRVRTANELYVPVGRPVHVTLESRDVIHSFWVPALQGKRDLVPGKRSAILLRADRAGVYGAQCAEFCGHQHAKMQLEVHALPDSQFQAWYEAQLRPAPEPLDSAQRRGREVFLSGTCPMCHTVMGTDAASRVGPDLTHLASRARIAAGTLPNTRGHLAGWIADPQRIKPGVRMPPNPLSGSDMQALLAWLESLK